MNNNNAASYEYQDLAVKRSMASIYADGYENLGWELEGINSIRKPPSVTMKFKRDRRVCRTEELSRLQWQFESCISDISSLESGVKKTARATAYAIGIIGTLAMITAVFAVSANMITCSIMLAISATVFWVLPYFAYHSIVKTKSTEIAPLIEQKYDELYRVYKKADGLLNLYK